MADHDQVHALLARVAEPINATAPPVQAFEQRERARRRRIAIGAPVTAIVTIIAVVLAIVAVRELHRGTTSAASTTTVSSAPPTPTVMTKVGVDALRSFQWKTLPPAPITPRNDAAGVWTGSRFIVWGGEHRADGASYDPTRRTWTRLPAAPITARANPTAVWTGHVVFIWGGTAGGSPVDDGATYDPSTRVWTRVSPGPSPSFGVQTVVVDGAPVVMTSDTDVPAVVARYDVADHHWVNLPPLPGRRDHAPRFGELLSTGTAIYAFQGWSRTIRLSGNSTAVSGGVDAFLYDASSKSWHAAPVTPTRRTGFPLFAASRIVYPVVRFYCGDCNMPAAMNLTGESIVLATGKRSAIAHGPVSDDSPTWFWTGNALLGVGSNPAISAHRPGQGAAWDPRSGRWTSLVPAPRGIDGAVVWTGSSVLAWGSAGGLEFRK